MSSGNQRQAVVMIESFRDVLPESVPSSSWRYPPSTPVVWVGPEKVAHRPLVRNLLYTVERFDVIQSIDTRGETAVEAEDLVVDERS